MLRTPLIAAIVMAASVSAAFAGAEVTLRDGRVLDGVEIRLAGDVYVIETADGGAISIPLDLVIRLKLTGGEEQQTGPAVREAGAERLAGDASDDRGPNGLDSSGPRTVAGREPRLADTGAQLRVLGPPATFSEGVVDSSWTPRGPWKLNLENNDFAPSHWAEAPVAPWWTPRSAFDGGVDVLAGGRARWQPGVFDPTWWPRDGFRRPATQSETAKPGDDRPGS